MGEKALAKAGKHFSRLLRIAHKKTASNPLVHGDDVAGNVAVKLGAITDRTAFDRTEDFIPFTACIIEHEHFNMTRKAICDLERDTDYLQLAEMINASVPEEDLGTLKIAMDAVFERKPGSAWWMRMHLDGESVRTIARIEGVSHTTMNSYISSIKSDLARELGCVE